MTDIEENKQTAEVQEEQKQDQEVKEDKKSQSKKECKKDNKKAEELSKQLESLKAENEKLAAQTAKDKDDYVRLMAEFETFRRRTSEDRLNLIGSASADTIKGLLPVLDDCERAMAMLESSSDEAAKKGTALIYEKLMAYLKTKGLEVIEAKGQKFDTDFHEAVTQFPAPDESLKGMVIDVVQTGYTLSGKVIRYAKVVVGA